MENRSAFSAFAFMVFAVTSMALHAAPPKFGARACPVTLDGVRLGSALTADNASLRNTMAYDPASGRFHLWVLAQPDAAFPASSTLTAYTHATSTDGIHFTRDGMLGFRPDSQNPADFGAVVPPPVEFVRASLAKPMDDQRRWKLFAWR